MKIIITALFLIASAICQAQSIYLDPLEKNEILFSELVSIKNARKVGKANNKRVLIYFSGYAVINARKIEMNVLRNEEVKSIMIKNFACFIAYVDDNRIVKSTKLTMGKRYTKIQIDYFKTNLQPFFGIVDEKGKNLSTIGYVSNPEYFIEFLNAGLE